MKLPRYAAVTFSLDTEQFAQRPTFMRDSSEYLFTRLMRGEEVAKSEFDWMGIKVTVRDAVSGEILR